MKIELQGTYNTRDLGSIRTKDSRTLRKNRLIRSDSLADITPEDEHILISDHSLKQILDLRTHNELSEQPPKMIADVIWIHLPMLKSGQPAAREADMSETEGSAPDADISMAQIFQASIAQMNYDVPAAINKMYKNLLSDDYSVAACRRFFELLLACDKGATLWHCTAGKDRTGVLALLLLGTLNVPQSTILEDYLISGINLEPQTKAIIDEIKKENDDPLLLRQAEILNSVLPEYVDSMMSGIKELGGDIPGYMNKVLGFSAGDLEDLRRLYLA